MSDALAQLMADKNWGYIWPCYALALMTFGGLAVRAFVLLRQWEKKAMEASPVHGGRTDRTQ